MGREERASHPEPGTGRAYHHGNLHEALVDAGLALARTGGPSAVVLRAVTREAGVSHNAAYRHFADHRALLAAVGARCREHLGALMAARTAAVTDSDPAPRAWARLEAIGRAYVDFALTEPGWFRTAFSGADEPAPAKAAPEHADPGTDPYLLLAERLDELVDVGALSAERREGAEYAAWSAVHGLAALLVDGPLRDLPATEARSAIRSVLGMVSRGLAT
ncbi:TetR/AcrR family transcriptional regulator [Kitasatospora sp. NPDC094015]|uniref:TetR/AcrR family transcriptional regulator n=1 Tax=Kitasatospora sp. NPDC094015 TaxID=3155205 RepID=UPI00332CABD3